ncbi:MAG TPA: alpha/beta fold hydrolase, partial [Accumulibacter sp.]|uniref:alpha/beta fold hydrolase n=1 Tax=Accumulibacter sp. TaxID=2053492 RepID=UPI002B89728A
LTADELAKADWAAYVAAENAILEQVAAEVTRKLPEGERVPYNRYYAESPVYPPRLSRDWNRSYVMEPDGPPRGAAVFLHGLTDSPYSLRHIARRYRELGYVAIAIRLPGHGTVPAGLSDVDWEDWVAATRLAVREARRRAGPDKPLHLVGFSNGGALAMKYALDALGDPSLPRADRLVLISPMIGVTALARFAGFFGWPAVFPAFAKASWLAVVPEFNPFKYNSFPINGARQSSLLTRALQEQIAERSRSGKIAGLPPVLTFQSVVDFTVSTRAIVTSLYAHLPANGSELVLFDVNRSAAFGALIRASANAMLNRILSDPPRDYRTTIVTNADAQHADMVARVVEAGSTAETVVPLAGLAYPRDVYSLSHVAIPFPMDDSLYGLTPNLADDYGANLGAMALRGETGTLIVSLDSLIRMSANPFFPFMLLTCLGNFERFIPGKWLGVERRVATDVAA